MDVEERARLVLENDARPAGDPDIIWSMGGIPRMNVRCMRPSVLEGNTGSLRVFEKNVMWKAVVDCIQVESKGEFPGGRFILVSSGTTGRDR
jgi:hypothetical protein